MPLSPWHTVSVPVIAPAASGIEFTLIQMEFVTPSPQSFTPDTVKFPEVAPAEKLIVIEFVPAPLAMVAPGSNDKS